MHESLNFGYEEFPAENNKYYIAYTPSFRDRGFPTKKNITIVLFLQKTIKMTRGIL